MDFLSALNVLNLQEFWTLVWVIFIHYTGHPLSSFNLKNGVVVLKNVLNFFIYYFHISISVLLKHLLSGMLDFLGCLCNFLIFSLCLLYLFVLHLVVFSNFTFLLSSVSVSLGFSPVLTSYVYKSYCLQTKRSVCLASAEPVFLLARASPPLTQPALSPSLPLLIVSFLLPLCLSPALLSLTCASELEIKPRPPAS